MASLSFALPVVAEDSEPSSPSSPKSAASFPALASRPLTQPLSQPPVHSNPVASSTRLPSSSPADSSIPSELFIRRVLQCSFTSYTGSHYPSSPSLPHGDGRATLASGAEYDGEFDRGLFHGHGSIRFPDGSSYTGEFQSHSLTGIGNFTWPDGAEYTGAMEDGYRSGYGVYSDPSKGLTYAGDWKRGLRHGRGKLSYTNTANHYYEGEWKDGKREGEGFMLYPSGNSYFGQWRQDRKSGRGIMCWTNRNNPAAAAVPPLNLTLSPSPAASPLSSLERYEGDWLNDLPHGTGCYEWFNFPSLKALETSKGPRIHTHFQYHNKYIGQFQEGKRHGFGRFFYANGAIYIGQWIDNAKQDPAALFLFENGTLYRGAFERDCMIDERVFHSLSTTMMDLPIEDLLEQLNGGSAASALIQMDRQFVSNLIARYNTDLIELFRVYSSPESTGDSSSLESFFSSSSSFSALSSVPSSLAGVRLSLKQFWLLATDFDFQSRFSLGWADLDSFLVPDSVYSFSPDRAIHDPERILLLREFYQILIRIAAVAMADQEEETPNEKEKEKEKDKDKDARKEKERKEESKIESTPDGDGADKKCTLSFYARAQTLSHSASTTSTASDAPLPAVSALFSRFLSSVLFPRSRSGRRRLQRRRFICDLPPIRAAMQQVTEPMKAMFIALAQQTHGASSSASLPQKLGPLSSPSTSVDSLLVSPRVLLAHLRSVGLFTDRFNLSSISQFLGWSSPLAFVHSSDLVWFEFQCILMRLAIFRYQLDQGAPTNSPQLPNSHAVPEEQFRFAEEWANQADAMIKLLFSDPRSSHSVVASAFHAQ